MRLYAKTPEEAAVVAGTITAVLCGVAHLYSWRIERELKKNYEKMAADKIAMDSELRTMLNTYRQF